MSTTNQTFTAEDLLAMPDDGDRYELVRGELRKMPPSGHVHGHVAMNFGSPLKVHVNARQLGRVYAAETGFKLASNPDLVRAPDVAFVSAERVGEVGDVDGYWPGAPNLAVEVVSPNDIYTEVEEKVFDWLEAGTKGVVVINPRKRVVTVYRSRTSIVVLAMGETLDCGDVVSGFSIAIADIFA
jgi:Uma2 family endonuclease